MSSVKDQIENIFSFVDPIVSAITPFCCCGMKAAIDNINDIYKVPIKLYL